MEVVTGYKRSYSVVIRKLLNEEILSGYPKVYPTAIDLANGYFILGGAQIPIMTDNELQTFTQSEYDARISLLKDYVIQQEGMNPFVNQFNENVVYDPENCVPQEITTTTTEITTTTTTTGITPVKYGALYNWFAAVDSRKISSFDEWVVPEKTDWDDLLNLFDTFIPGINIWEIGGNLKENGLIHWLTPNEGGIGKYNLNLVGCGNRNYSFGEINEQSAYWTSTQVDSLNAYSISFYYQNSNASLGEQPKQLGNPCRLRRLATIEELLLPDGTYCTLYVGNDGKQYKTVKIGTLVWLAENLNETQWRDHSWIEGFNNGIYTPISNEDWVSRGIAGEGLMCYYDDDESNG